MKQFGVFFYTFFSGYIKFSRLPKSANRSDIKLARISQVVVVESVLRLSELNSRRLAGV